MEDFFPFQADGFGILFPAGVIEPLWMIEIFDGQPYTAVFDGLKSRSHIGECVVHKSLKGNTWGASGRGLLLGRYNGPFPLTDITPFQCDHPVFFDDVKKLAIVTNGSKVTIQIKLVVDLDGGVGKQLPIHTWEREQEVTFNVSGNPDGKPISGQK